MADVVFAPVAVLSGEDDVYLTGVTDLTIAAGPSGPLVYVTSGPGGGVAVYAMAGDALVLSDRFSLPAQGTAGVESSLIMVDLGPAPAALVTGVAGAGLWGVGVDAAGDLTARVTLNLNLPPDLITALAVTVEGQDYLYGLRLGSAATSVWRIGADGRLVPVSQPAPAQSASAGPVLSDMASVVRGGETWLVTTSAGSDALICSRLAADGVPAEADRIGADEGLGISDPVAVVTAIAGGRAYAVFAAAGTGTLSVAEVRSDGTLAVTDHVMDDQGTRFQDAAIVETITIGGRVYVVAAGSDDGITLMELLPGGRLLDLGSQADGTGTGLDNVSAVALTAAGGDLQIAVASGSEAGLTWLSVDLKAGSILNGTGSAETLTGGSGDDRLAGGAGNDRLSGDAGRDVIMDGAGTDMLIGGSGADRFVMEADGLTDTINDFDPAEDSIDLSAWAFLRSVGQLKIYSTSTGAQIRFGAEILNIRSASGGSLDLATVRDLDLIGLSRIGPGWVRPVTPPQTFDGTPGADVPLSSNQTDVLQGRGGDDTLRGGYGNDRLFGGDGNDRVEGENGSDRVEGGSGRDVLWGGVGNDRLAGGDGNDALWGWTENDRAYGDAGADILHLEAGQDEGYGGRGRDRIYGGDGRDLIRGEGEADSLHGGSGDDSLFGEDGFDALRGDDGVDRLYGDGGDDRLYGGAGNDRLSGGPGRDGLHGDAGDDRLYGGDGRDTLFGGEGRDTLYGGYGNDRLSGMAGADRFVFAGGQDRITDFRNDLDTIVIGDSLWGGKAPGVTAILDAAVVTPAGTRIEFGDGQWLLIEGLERPDQLRNDILII